MWPIRVQFPSYIIPWAQAGITTELKAKGKTWTFLDVSPNLNKINLSIFKVGWRGKTVVGHLSCMRLVQDIEQEVRYLFWICPLPAHLGISIAPHKGSWTLLRVALEHKATKGP